MQDAIFSRSVSNAKKTGIFICGKDASLALDMMDAAKNAMVPPFEISVFLIQPARLQQLLLWLHVLKKH